MRSSRGTDPLLPIVSNKMFSILFHCFLLNLSVEAFNVTLFKSHVLNYYNYIRWVHNAPPLVEDKSLENGAAYWAYYLSTYPSPQCLHHNQAGGQNIYFTWHPQEISEYDLARATMQAFYSEKRYYDYSRPNFNHDASHFTNLIWKSTQRIGIAVYWKSFYNQHGGCHMQAWPSRPLLGQMVVINEWPRGNTMTPYILNYHNYIRSVHNAQPLVEDSSLEAAAADWAFHLASYPNQNCLYHNQLGGQNIYFTWQTKEMTEYDLARAAMKAFYQEKKFYDYSRPYFDSRASHFTNLIWKSTQRIGIALYSKKFYDQHGGCRMQAWTSSPLIGYAVVINEWPRGNTMTPQEFKANVLPAKQEFVFK